MGFPRKEDKPDKFDWEKYSNTEDSQVDKSVHQI